jgi:hypothetical protein
MILAARRVGDDCEMRYNTKYDLMKVELTTDDYKQMWVRPGAVITPEGEIHRHGILTICVDLP